MDYGSLVPEACLLAGGVGTLLSGSFLPRRRQWVARLIAVAALLASGSSAAFALGTTGTVFSGSYAIDTGTGAARLVVVSATLLVIGLGVDELAGNRRESETYALLLMSALGAVVVAGADDLLVLAVGFLLASIPVYGLIGLGRTRLGAEAAVKTYLLGALAGIVMLLGITVLAGVGGGTGYRLLADRLAGAPAVAVAFGALAVLAGLLFEAGAVPMHPWVPDAAEGSGVTVAAFLTTVPKIGALLAILRLVTVLPAGVPVALLVGVLAAASLVLGTFAAFAQRHARRLLGWSTVSQAGFLLLPVAVAGRSDLALPSLLVYLAGYAVTNLCVFAVVAALPGRHTLTDYRGLAREHPWAAAALVVGLLSLVGTPPTAVFLGKLTTFTAAWDGGLAWLVVIAAAATVASLFYVLRWIVPVFAGPADPPEQHQDRAPWAAGAATAAAVGVLALGLGGGPLLDLAQGALAR